MNETSSHRRRRATRLIIARSTPVWLVLLALCAPPARAASSRPDRDLYLQAKRARSRLESSRALQKKRTEWQRVVDRFLGIPLRYPRSAYCDDALLAAGDLYRKMGGCFKNTRYLDEAVTQFNLIVSEYPSSSLGEEALYACFQIEQERGRSQAVKTAGKRYLENYGNSTRARNVRRALERRAAVPRESLPKAPPKGLARVFSIRSWSGENATRVVLDLERPVRFQRGVLENPDRVYVDLLGSHLHSNLTARSFPIGDGLLKQIRVGQYNDQIVRVVLDLNQVGKDTIFFLQDPTRLVIDVNDPYGDRSLRKVESPGVAATVSPSSAMSRPVDDSSADPNVERHARVDLSPTAPTPPKPNSGGSFSLVRQLGLSARRIVIDPGHGGHDPGTIGRSGLQEKDLVLDVSLRVARLIREKLGIEIVMTRTTDVYVPLEERTAIANAREADLLLSIHANSSRNRSARGIETYYLNFAVDAHAEEVAARENAISPATVKDLSALVKAITQNGKIQESRDFAAHVQRAMVSQMREGDPRLPNRGVRRAPFYVLLGARMPAILVEIAFVSNSADEKLLKTPGHRDEIAVGIVEGVAAYLEELNGDRAPRLTYRSDRPKVPIREARR